MYGCRYGDLGSSGNQALYLAILKGRTAVVERYIQNIADKQAQLMKDAIAIASLGGHDAMIRFLADHGMDLNEEGILGTPLRAASVMGHESSVLLLLKLGANIHAKSSFGEPLQAAAMRGHGFITRPLLEYGANVDSNGGLYGSALQAAAYVKLLLDTLSGNPQEADVYGEALSEAMQARDERMACLLLENAAPPTVDILRQARSAGLQEVLKMLVDAGIEHQR